MNAVMAKPKRKKEPEPPKDLHRARKMFRVEDDIHAGFQELSRRNDRPMSREFRAALIRHLRDNGLWPPQSNSH